MMPKYLKWLQHNLFSKPFDALLSFIIIFGVLWLVYEITAWTLTAAQWNIISQSLRVLMIGIFPADQAWRAWIAVIILSALLGAALGGVFSFKTRHAAFLALAVAALAPAMGTAELSSLLFLSADVVVFACGWALTSRLRLSRKVLMLANVIGTIAVFTIMTPPGANLWGGLLLSILLTLVTSIASLPIGILLAFGRRNRFSSVRWICAAYIEAMRSVPLIMVVYWIWILMPVLAPQLGLADVVRGMIGFTLFYSAYVAEYVKSGLQAVPYGQTEAARSLGMSEFDINISIILPQAIRVALPPLVGNLLDIFNTAPLIFIIGLTDFLRAGQMILANPQYGDRTYEIYSFLFLTYFLVGSLITFVTRKLEAHMAQGSQ